MTEQSRAMPFRRERFTAETHTRIEILTEKRIVDFAIQDIKHEIAEARRKARVDGIYVAPSEFARMETRKTRLARKSQMLQDELTRMREMRKQPSSKTVEQHFIEVCREELTGKEMQEFMAEAKRRASTATNH